MRIRTAVPILFGSAAVMVAGLGLAGAQDRPQTPTPTIPVPTQRGLGDALKKAVKNRPQQAGGAQTPAQQAAQKVQQAARGQQAPGTPATPGAPGPESDVNPFETGIEFHPTSPGSRITFNLEDADLPELVRLISSITGRRFILPAKSRSIKATVFAPTKVTAAEAYRAFLSILSLNGMTVVPSGRYLKVVETTNMANNGTVVYRPGSTTPADDRYVTRMQPVENISAEDAANVLNNFKSSEGSITAYAPTNMLIITDMGSNIRRMLRVLEAVDVPRTGEQIWIEPIHYANATELASRLQEIFQVGQPASAGPAQPRQAQRPTPPRGQNARRATAAAAGNAPSTVGNSSGESRITKILPDERTNSLILVATERAYLRILEMIRQLDVPLEGEGRIHVHYVQHGDAEEISSTLSSLIGGGGGAARPGGGARAAQAATAAAGGGDLFEGDIRVTAHKPSNALVITSSLHDYASLRRVIERLDAPRRQVFIEAVIMEMTIDRSRNLGLSFHGGGADFPSDGSLLIGGSNAAGSLGFGLTPDSLTGLALGIRGPEIPESPELIGISIPAFGVALNALATSGDGNVLSTPHIIAIDNVEAEISVGSNVPLQTSGFNTGGLGALAGLAGAQGAGAQGAAGLSALSSLGGGGFNVPRQDVGTTIRLTPHINDSDEIRLEIEEEISEAEPSTEGTLGVRSVSKRTAKTQMVVQDQQTVVIGGLMRDRVINEESKIPILGDIPLLGVLFRQTKRQTRKTNLLLFLTPYIIRDASDLRAIFERKMRERQEFIDRYFVFGDHDYEPPVDYTRTRGLVAEIINELEEIEVERQLHEAAQGRPPPEHVPRAAVGAAPDMGDSGDSGEPEEGDVVIGPDGEIAPEVLDEVAPPVDFAPTPDDEE